MDRFWVDKVAKVGGLSPARRSARKPANWLGASATLSHRCEGKNRDEDFEK